MTTRREEARPARDWHTFRADFNGPLTLARLQVALSMAELAKVPGEAALTVGVDWIAWTWATTVTRP